MAETLKISSGAATTSSSDGNNQEKVDFSIKTPALLAEKIYNNPNLQGMITLPHYETVDSSPITVTIPFYLEENFSFSLSNKWGTLVPFIEGMSGVAGVWNMITMLVKDEPEAQATFACKAMQTATWQSSEYPSFQINTTFVCTRRNHNPINIIKYLSEAALPRPLSNTYNTSAKATTNGVGDSVIAGGNTIKESYTGTVGQGIGSGITRVGELAKTAGLAAPLFYNPNPLNDDHPGEVDINNCITLQIGKWFRATKLIVNSISNISFSKEVVAPPTGFVENHTNFTHTVNSTEYGFPLYVKCTLMLRPVTLITYDEFIQYFTIPSLGMTSSG